MTVVPASGSPGTSGSLGLLARCWLCSWRGLERAGQDVPGDVVPTPAEPGAALRVLVVDDNPVNLMTVAALLESRGLVPALARDGAEAVALAREQRFDLILMDLEMPGLDGLQATLCIRCLEGAACRTAVPVLAFSSTAPTEAVLAMHGMNGRLGKPCETEELEACLQRWCPGYLAAPAAQPAARDGDGRLGGARSPASGRAP